MSRLSCSSALLAQPRRARGIHALLPRERGQPPHRVLPPQGRRRQAVRKCRHVRLHRAHHRARPLRAPLRPAVLQDSALKCREPRLHRAHRRARPLRAPLRPAVLQESASKCREPRLHRAHRRARPLRAPLRPVVLQDSALKCREPRLHRVHRRARSGQALLQLSAVSLPHPQQWSQSHQRDGQIQLARTRAH